MKKIPVQFIFERYAFAPHAGVFRFFYRTTFRDSSSTVFEERIHIPHIGTLTQNQKDAIARLLPDMHIALGISYYKCHLAPRMILRAPISNEEAMYWNTIYRKGLGEFCYANNVAPARIAQFSASKRQGNQKQPIFFQTEHRALLGIGGGKDSVLASHLLNSEHIAHDAFVVETNNNATLARNVARRLEKRVHVIRRVIDPKVLSPSSNYLKGHVPFSMILAYLGALEATARGYRDVIVANEESANHPTLRWNGKDINHQWSKSQEFETLFSARLYELFGPNVRYFSILRPFTELSISRMSASLTNILPYISSCNRNFRIKRNGSSKSWKLEAGSWKLRHWCGKCPKCVSQFMLWAPFVGRQRLIHIFGKNIYGDATLVPLMRALLGKGKGKPFECVARTDEYRAALVLAHTRYKNDTAYVHAAKNITVNKTSIQQLLHTSPAQNIPPEYRFLGMKRILILGYGKEGKATREFLKKKYPDRLIGIADEALHGRNYLTRQDSYDIAIKTPGIPHGKVTIPYTTATNIFFSSFQNARGNRRKLEAGSWKLEARIVGITASKGKSTTASLLYHILKTAGKRTLLAGNIGTPMLSLLQNHIHPDTTIVLELSSYQLDDAWYSPHIAAVLNLFESHLTYHGNIKNYFSAKKNIIRAQTPNDYFVFDPTNPVLRAWADEGSAKSVPLIPASKVRAWKRTLSGPHNIENIRTATTIACLLGVSTHDIRRGVAKFSPLPHRLEHVGNFHGIDFYDDAIASAPNATIAALKTLPNTETIFLGGEKQGYDFRGLERALRASRVKNIVLFPDSGQHILRNIKRFRIFKTRSMKEAIHFAYRHTSKGAICLLSTASPSYSLWENFEEKGDQFQRMVKMLGK